MSLVTEMMPLNTEESGRELRMYYDIKKIHDDHLHDGYASVHSCFKYSIETLDISDLYSRCRTYSVVRITNTKQNTIKWMCFVGNKFRHWRFEWGDLYPSKLTQNSPYCIPFPDILVAANHTPAHSIQIQMAFYTATVLHNISLVFSQQKAYLYCCDLVGD